MDRPRTDAGPGDQRTANLVGDARAVIKCLGKSRDTQYKQEACGFPGAPHHQWGDPVDNVEIVICSDDAIQPPEGTDNGAAISQYLGRTISHGNWTPIW